MNACESETLHAIRRPLAPAAAREIASRHFKRADQHSLDRPAARTVQPVTWRRPGRTDTRHTRMKMLLGLAGLLCLQCGVAAGLRVLMVSTVSTRSHYIWTNALTEGLLAAGHHVTELTTLSPAVPHPNRTTFAVGKMIVDDWAYDDMEDLSGGSAVEQIFLCISFLIDNHKATLESQAFRDAVKHIRTSKDKFDVMVLDYAWEQIMIGMAGVASRPPVVAITAYIHPVEVSTLVGNPHLPALVPHDIANMDVKMDFCERLSNLWYYLLSTFLERWYFWPIAEELYLKHFGETAPALSELRGDVALAMVNTHPALHGSRPLVPSIVEVGLLQTKPGKPLPANLKEWLDGATHGFVYMSFGSIMKGSMMSKKKRDAVLQTFSVLKQRVLWKFETDDINDELPPNVRIEKWLPQNDILAHPNIKAFVSHGGGLSTQELAYHGVPVLGVPFVVDQFRNAKKAERLGIGRVLAYNKLNGVSFLEALKDVVGNPMYRENAKRLSAVLRDQKETPLERAVWWVEYVARTGGAPHLRSHALDLHWYQVHLLDVAAALAVLLASPLLLLWLLCRLCRRSAHSKSKTD